MISGIPGSALIALTLISPGWLGPVDKSEDLTEDEQRLSVALGIVTALAVFQGFTVHLLGFLLDPHWGLCRNASQSGRGGDRAGTAAIVRDRRVRAGVTQTPYLYPHLERCNFIIMLA